MNCKNCGNTLRTDYSFCPDCGAKVIRNRITAKNLWYDIVERYFNLDNTLLRTLRDMVLKPNIVCENYIKGVRKKYLNPISLLAISLTLSGFMLFLMQKVSWQELDFSNIIFGANAQQSKNIMGQTMEYSSLLFLCYIPVAAFCSYVLFNTKNYNFPEHIVIGLYTLGSFSILSFPISATLLLINPQGYVNFSFWYSLIMVLYCIYVATKMTTFRIKSISWRGPIYLLLFICGYLGFSIVFIIIMFISGTYSIEDFAPKN